MKAVFIVNKENDMKAMLEEVAQQYQSHVQNLEEEGSYVILVKPKLQIRGQEEQVNYLINVWGAKEEDMNYLKTIFGEPTEISVEPASPLEFAEKLIAIPEIEGKSPEEIMMIMDLNIKEFEQYKRLLSISARRGSAPEVVREALKLLER